MENCLKKNIVKQGFNGLEFLFFFKKGYLYKKNNATSIFHIRVYFLELPLIICNYVKINLFEPHIYIYVRAGCSLNGTSFLHTNKWCPVEFPI